MKSKTSFLVVFIFLMAFFLMSMGFASAIMLGSCTDSDNGNNIYTYGTAKGQLLGGQYIEHRDRCIVTTGNGGGYWVSSCTGSNCAVDEAYCRYCDSSNPNCGSSVGYYVYTFPYFASCPTGCRNGACLYVCSQNSDCGTNSWEGSLSCSGNNIVQNYRTYTCINPGISSSSCSSSVSSQVKSICPSGQVCSSGTCIISYTYSWQTGSWGSCSSQCEGAQTRTVTCLRSDGTTVLDSYCSGTKPATSQSCGGCSSGQVCSSGTCVTPTCSSNFQCGTNSWEGSLSCSGNNVMQDYRTYTCNNPGTAYSSCSSIISLEVKSNCFGGQICSAGVCINPTCSQNSDCGTNSWEGSLFCSGDNITQNYLTYTCNNPGTASSSCNSAVIPQFKQLCFFGCSNGICMASSECVVPKDNDKVTNSVYFCQGYYSISNLSVEADNVFIDCNNSILTKWGGTLFNLYKKNSVTIKNCRIERYNYGFIIENSSNIILQNITCSGDNNFCAYFLNSNSSSIFNSTMSHSYDSGLVLRNSHQTKIFGNSFIGNMYQDGIYLYDSSNNIIENNNISENANSGSWTHRAGIAIMGRSSNNTISNNFIEGNNWNGVYYSGIGSNNNIVNNSISNNSYNNVFMNTNQNIYAGYNWWGSNDEATIKSKIWDCDDGSYPGCIDIIPFLCTPYFPGNAETNCSIACSQNSDCGTDSWEGALTCLENNVMQDYRTYTCNNPGTAYSSCSSIISSQIKQTCSEEQVCLAGSCATQYTYSWQTGSWGSCSSQCEGAQTRTVTCLRSDGTTVLDSYCSGTKPATSQSCGGCSSGQVCSSGTCVASSPYSITDISNSGNVEHRLYYNSFHFMSIIETGGAISIRPHPGTDVNGWGSSLYLQPFFPGAVLKNTIVNSITYNNNNIYINISGNVSKGSSEKYGNWNSSLKFSYDQSNKKISGNGTYSVTLSGALSTSTGDLNLYKLASNYLSDVPLLSGGIGDTGDMKQADVIAATTFTWNPKAQPAHFPSPATDYLSIDVIGDYNQVNTSAQGYAPIAAAYKPSMKVVLQSERSGISMIFGGIYDTTKSTEFWADNVGITPLILKSSTDRNFDFDIQFESQALPGG